MIFATLSTHVLDIGSGTPASGLSVDLLRGNDANTMASGVTDTDGRIRTWTPDVQLEPGDYQLRFHSGQWYRGHSKDCFYPTITIHFSVLANQSHYHVPLLLNQFGYSTYRGS